MACITCAFLRQLQFLLLPAKRVHEVPPTQVRAFAESRRQRSNYRRDEGHYGHPKMCHYTYWYRRTRPRSSGWASGLSDRELSIDSAPTLSNNAKSTPATSDEIGWKPSKVGNATNACLTGALLVQTRHPVASRPTLRKVQSFSRVSCHGGVHPGHYGDQQQHGMGGSDIMYSAYKVNRGVFRS